MYHSHSSRLWPGFRTRPLACDSSCPMFHANLPSIVAVAPAPSLTPRSKHVIVHPSLWSTVRVCPIVRVHPRCDRALSTVPVISTGIVSIPLRFPPLSRRTAVSAMLLSSSRSSTILPPPTPPRAPHRPVSLVCRPAVRFTHDVIVQTAMGIDPHSLDVRQGEPCPTLDAILGMAATVQRLVLDPVSV